MVRKADVATFVALNHIFAKDKNQVWTSSGIIKEADVESFRVLDSGFGAVTADNRGYASDRNQVYFLEQYYGKASVLKNADPSTFQSFDNGFGKDSQKVYYGRFQLPKAQPESWRHLQGPFSRDATHVYFENGLVPKADPERFDVLPPDGWWGRDEKNYYAHSVGTSVGAADKNRYFEKLRNVYIFVGVVKGAYVVDAAKNRVAGETWADMNAGQRVELQIECTEWLYQPQEKASNQPSTGECISISRGWCSAPTDRCMDRKWIWFFAKSKHDGIIRPMLEADIFEPIEHRSKVEKLIGELRTST
jgi:hypothetical protein